MRIRKPAKNGQGAEVESAAAHPAAPTAGEKAVSSESVTLPVDLLHPAEWNPRPKITSESVADICASLKTVGLIQPIAVWKDASGDGYTILAGHRRFRACLDAGWTEIPCTVKTCDEREARQITFIENLQRKDPDPILEARNIQSLLDMGLTMPEIAKQSGRSLGWVANRKQLTALASEWVDILPKVNINIDALEKVSRYRPEVQREALKGLKPYLRWGSENLVRWRDISHEFARHERRISDATFDTSCCRSCPNNSACAPLLFPDIAHGDGDEGTCLDRKCFAEKTNEAVKALVREHQAKGREAVPVKSQYDAPEAWNMRDKYSAKTPVLYTWEEGGMLRARFGVKPSSERKELTPEERRDRERREHIKRARAGLWAFIEDGRFEAFLRGEICHARQLPSNDGFVDLVELAAVLYIVAPDNAYLLHEASKCDFGGFSSALERDMADAFANYSRRAFGGDATWTRVWGCISKLFLDRLCVMRGGLDGIWRLWGPRLRTERPYVIEDSAVLADYEEALGMTKPEAEGGAE